MENWNFPSIQTISKMKFGYTFCIKLPIMAMLEPRSSCRVLYVCRWSTLRNNNRNPDTGFCSSFQSEVLKDAEILFHFLITGAKHWSTLENQANNKRDFKTFPSICVSKKKNLLVCGLIEYLWLNILFNTFPNTNSTFVLTSLFSTLTSVSSNWNFCNGTRRTEYWHLPA